MNRILIIAVSLVSTILGHDLRSSNEFDSDNDHYESKERIVGGTEAADHSRPWMVFLYNNRQTKSKLCGGALIKPQWVLTAAHCVDEGNSYTLMAGSNQVCIEVFGTTIPCFGNTAELRNASEVHLKKSWNNKTFENDIALVKLSSPFTINQNTKLIKLATTTFGTGEKLEVSGWGSTSGGSTTRVARLRTVELPVVSNEDCKKSFPTTLFSTTMCAGYADGSKGICDGDSGSPLVKLNGDNSLLVGIVSQAKQSCTSYSVYTIAKSYEDWIKQTIGN